MKATFFAVALLGFFTVTTFAQTDFTMITSPAALRSYAYGKVARGQISVGSRSMLNGSKNYVNTELLSGGATVVMASLNELAEFKYSVSDVRDPVGYWGYLMDEDWETLFFGGQSAVLQFNDKTGRWIVPPELETIKLTTMVTQVPIKVKGIVSARVIVRDAKGNVLREDYLNVRNGKLYFPEGYTGRMGELIVTKRSGDDSIVDEVYDLLTGKANTPTSVNSRAYVSIEGVLNFFNSSVKLDRQPKDTLSILTVTVDSMIAAFGATAPGGETPRAVLIRKSDGQSWYRQAIEIGDSVSLKILAGEWHVIFEWEPDQYRELPVVYHWDYDGGKG